MNKLEKDSVIGISALLVHAAKIDEVYSEHEKDLVKNFIRSYIQDSDIEEILQKAEEIEKNSNQLLSFTNIIKQNSIDVKNLKCNNWGQQAEILTYVVNKNSKIFEIGVNYHGRTYNEGKKIRYYDVFSVIYWIFATKIKKNFV